MHVGSSTQWQLLCFGLDGGLRDRHGTSVTGWSCTSWSCASQSLQLVIASSLTVVRNSAPGPACNLAKFVQMSCSSCSFLDRQRNMAYLRANIAVAVAVSLLIVPSVAVRFQVREQSASIYLRN